MEPSNESYSIYTLAFVFTVLTIIFASWYTLRNVLRLWTAGKPRPLEESDEEVEEDETNSQHGEHNENGFSSEKNDGDWIDLGASGESVDPVEYCEHIQSEVKKAKQRVATRHAQQSLSDQEIEEERRVQREQLEQIFKLMEEQNNKFGVNSFDEVQQQMKLYA